MAVTPLREFTGWQDTLTRSDVIGLGILRPLRPVLAHGHLSHEHLKADCPWPWWAPPILPRRDLWPD